MIDSVVFQGKTCIPYFTFADPSIAFTKKLITQAFDAGASIIEVGFPFSDPIADGPVIQASHQRALDNNPDITLDSALDMVAEIKQDYSQPLVFMLASNLVHRYGIDRFFSEARAKKLDGVIIPDLPIEESQDYQYVAEKYGIDIIYLVSPLCGKERLKVIVNKTSGFLYVISSTGTTGLRENMSASLETFCQEIKAIRDIPLAVGFGVSSKSHVDFIHTFADAAIVGSYFTKQLNENIDNLDQACDCIIEDVKHFSH